MSRTPPAPKQSPIQPVRFQNNSSTLWRSYQYLRPYWPYIAGTYLFIFGINAINILNPQLIARAIDRGIRQSDLGLLTGTAALLLGLTVLKGFFTYFQGRWSETASQNVAADLRAEIQEKLTSLSFSYHDQAASGDLLSRTIQDVERIRFLTGRATLRIIEGSILLAATAGILFWMNSRLALLAVMAMPLLIYRALYFGRRYRPLSLIIQQQVGALTTRLEQNLRGARVVKAFAQEQAEIDQFEALNEHFFNLSIRAARMEAQNVPLLHLIANIGAIMILWYGGTLVVQNQLTLGELVAFTAYLAQLINPVRLLGMIVPAIAMAGSAGERIFEIIDAAPDVKDAPDAVPLPPVRGQVRFENVSFAYRHRYEALRKISFEAQPGQVVALLGPTGSGKSTVINMIPRFYDPTAGRVLIDGYDLCRVTLNSLRSQIGIVLQETTLFAASIGENIAFGRPGAAQAEILAAAQAAQMHEFISQMPDGYDTQVGERGVTLSGGQKQRLAIARALLLDPRILILDDATSSVDTETEKLIQEAMERVMRGRTSFVIAHRLSTLHNADQILVLEKGRIAARGTHSELLKSSRLYADIYQRQLKLKEGRPT